MTHPEVYNIIALKERVKQLEAQTDNRQPNYTHNSAEYLRLKQENRRLRRAIEFVDNWCKAYPIDIFPEPDMEKAHKILKENGMTLDAISASNMHHVITRVREELQKALEE